MKQANYIGIHFEWKIQYCIKKLHERSQKFPQKNGQAFGWARR